MGGLPEVQRPSREELERRLEEAKRRRLELTQAQQQRLPNRLPDYVPLERGRQASPEVWGRPERGAWEAQQRRAGQRPLHVLVTSPQQVRRSMAEERAGPGPGLTVAELSRLPNNLERSAPRSGPAKWHGKGRRVMLVVRRSAPPPAGASSSTLSTGGAQGAGTATGYLAKRRGKMTGRWSGATGRALPREATDPTGGGAAPQAAGCRRRKGKGGRGRVWCRRRQRWMGREGKGGKGQKGKGKGGNKGGKGEGKGKGERVQGAGDREGAEEHVWG